MKNEVFKIALLQLDSNVNIKENTIKGEIYCRKAKESNADLVVFPEMWSNGYDFLFEGEYTKDVKNVTTDKVTEYYSHALDINSDFIQKFIDLAKELKIAIAITFLEKNIGNRQPKNTVCIIDRTGKIILKYSKVHTVDFKMEHFIEPGDNFYTSELDYGRGKVKLGAMICYDRDFPESARILMLQGSEIIICPNACYMNKIRLDELKVRAYENMVGIVTVNYANMGGKSSAFTPIVRDENKNEIESKLLVMDDRESIDFVEFNLDNIRTYRKRETLGNTYRKVGIYKELINSNISEPFIRTNFRKGSD